VDAFDARPVTDSPDAVIEIATDVVVQPQRRVEQRRLAPVDEIDLEPGVE